MDTYPEHEKLSKIKDQSQTIGEFLDWLDTEGLYLGEYDENGLLLYPTHKRHEYILATYFEINLDKLED